MGYSYQQQLEVISIVNDFLRANEDVFDRQKAIRLREIIFAEADLRPSNPFTVAFWDHRHKTSKSNMVFAGVPGGATFSTEEKRHTDFTLGERGKLLAGSWSLTCVTARNGSSAILIQNRFNGTKEDPEMYSAIYDAKGRPVLFNEYGMSFWKIPFVNMAIRKSYIKSSKGPSPA